MKAILRSIFRQPFARPIVARYLRSQLQGPYQRSTSDDRLRIVALDADRFRPDLDNLCRHPKVELFELAPTAMDKVNGLFFSELEARLPKSKRSPKLFDTDPEHLTARRKLEEFLAPVLQMLADQTGIQGFISCGVYYRRNASWESAALKAGLTYFCLHKETFCDPAVVDTHIPEIENIWRTFNGSRLFVVSRNFQQMLKKVNYFDPERTTIVGFPRFDGIYREVAEGRLPAPRRKVTLFSFAHRSGRVDFPDRTNFSKTGDLGFVRLFDNLHAAMARLAVRNPDIEVVIKLKWMGDDWEDLTRKAVVAGTGRSVEEIPNLVVTDQTPAQNLMRDSAVVVSFNSTTVIEAKQMKRPVVLPIFDEARDKYFDTNVYFKDHFDSFVVADSPDDLIEKVEELLAEKKGVSAADSDMTEQFISDYIGFYDGRATDRVVEAMQTDIRIAGSL